MRWGYHRFIETNVIRIAYPVVFLALVVLGYFVHFPLWGTTLIGVLVMLPIVVADWIVTSRAKSRRDEQ